MTASARMELDDRGVLTVTLSRPEQRNPLDVEAWRVLGEAFGERAHTPGVRAVVLRGEGDSFCSGLDRSLLVQVAGGGNGQGADIDASLLQGTVDSIDGCPPPPWSAGGWSTRSCPGPGSTRRPRAGPRAARRPHPSPSPTSSPSCSPTPPAPTSPRASGARSRPTSASCSTPATSARGWPPR